MKKILIIVLVLLIFTLGLAACAPNSTIGSKYDTVKQTKMDNYTLLNDTAKHGQVVMIGDSIVELYPTHELFTGDTIVYNRGISGDTSDRMLQRLTTNALKIQPQAISILIGTNDNNYGLSDASTLANIQSSIELIHSELPECRIIIQSIYPVNKAINSKMVGGRKNADIIALNAKIKAICDSSGATYVDVFGSLIDAKGSFSSDYTYDGLHPNAAGYIAITRVLSTVLF